jgi:hypothetical protein
MTAQPGPVRLRDEPVSMRRLSRRFAAVGVDIPAARLREMADGYPATDTEIVDVSFALVITANLSEERRAKRGRVRRRLLHWLMVAGAILIALNLLACLGFVLFLLAQHPQTY